MNKDRDNYLSNLSSSYLEDTNEINQQDDPNDFWYEVGSTLPHFSIGYILGAIVGTLIGIYLMWPILDAFFGTLYRGVIAK